MNFLLLRLLNKNGMVERKNKTIKKMTKMMINSKKLTTRLWAEAVSTACHTINRVFIKSGISKTSYEL